MCKMMMDHMRGPFIAAAVLVSVVSVAAQTGGATMTLSTKPSPLGLGQNVFEVSLKDARDRPIADSEIAIVLLMPADPRTKHPEMKTEGKLNNLGKGRYDGIVMVTMAGVWDVTVTATRNGKPIGQKKERMTAYLTRPKPAVPSEK